MQRTLRPEKGFYKVSELLGEGSTGRVFKALKIDSRGFSRQLVALKILKSESQVQTLIREMEALTRVKSPHCVSLLGWENTEDGPALVMEWVDGVSLETLARHHHCSDEVAREIVSQVQEGLRHLHAEGLFHGDLSPSNILIDTQGRVRLVDFGLSHATAAGVGTVRFMSPERWEGRAACFEDDLFGLGLLFADLRRGDLNKSASADFWRRRAFEMRGTDEDLLHAAPIKRTFAPVDGNYISRALLGRMVRETQISQKKLSRTIGVKAFEKSYSMIWAWVMALIFLFPITPFGQSAKNYSAVNASLEIRTLTWIRANLDSQDLGYAPVSRAGLTPGVHRLNWVSPRGRGTKFVPLGFGEHKVLGDSDFTGP